MENQILETPKKFNKKKIAMFVLPILALITIMASVIYFATVPVVAHVGEALSTATVSLNMSGFSGETITKNISINNDANVPLNVLVAWTETTNTGTGGVNITYTTDMPKTILLVPGANDINVQFTYANDSTIGDLAGNVILSRTA